MTSPTDPQLPSEPGAERRDNIMALWKRCGGTWMDSWVGAQDGELLRFVSALDAQSAERTRAEVEKMRETAVHAIQDEAAETEDGETLEALNRAIERLRALPIESPSRCKREDDAIEIARLEAFEEAAKIAEGVVVEERYRTWPHWNPKGNLSMERGETLLALATAAAIRALSAKGTSR